MSVKGDLIIANILRETGLDLRNIPTADVAAAELGTNGTPGASNKFVTNSDSRLVGGGTVFDFTQSSPATTWTINHNLGRNPDVSVRNVGGSIILVEILHITVNMCQVYFIAATAGTASCS